jgi:hypothetical protein
MTKHFFVSMDSDSTDKAVIRRANTTFISIARRWCINGKNMAIFIKTLIAK